MIKTLCNILTVFVVSLVLIACDSNQEKHQKTLEEKLVDSFEQADAPVRDQVSIIVAASNQKSYAYAMNELAILSATRLNSREQKFAIKQLMDQLRFNMEEVEFARAKDGLK